MCRQEKPGNQTAGAGTETKCHRVRIGSHNGAQDARNPRTQPPTPDFVRNHSHNARLTPPRRPGLGTDDYTRPAETWPNAKERSMPLGLPAIPIAR